jgi:class 3 adenylate cyclase/pSer/pThr/pTyr-binding forkhead associated (FHA) protein
VTVVFCDLADSTNLGEQLDPESLRRVISRYYEEMTRTVERHGGRTVKFIGDAVMAVFGMPVVHENDALRAVRTAAEMSPALDRLNRELEDRWGVRLDIRTGVNTGEVVVCEADPAESAVIGEVVGDAVNVAARLEQAATAGEVLIGADTYRLVRDTVNAEAVEPLEVKGKSRPVRAYRLLDVVSGETGGAGPLDSPIVGRDRELEQLTEAFERTVTGKRCELVTVLGPAGIGKSRLVHELAERLEDRATTLKGRCLPYGEGITFWPIAEIAREVTGIGEGKQPEEVAANVAALLPDDESASDVMRAVADAIGVADTTADTEEIAWAVRRLFEALARKRPVIVVFDDVHWAEPTFLDLIEDLVVESRDVPMLVICMARGELLESRPDWGAEIEHAGTLALDPLASADSERLIGNLLGVTELDEVGQRIVSTAEGNPLFLQETLRMLVDDGLLQRRGRRWRAVGELSAVAIPPTIRALLAARLDRLSQAERLVLERAAIVGLEFWRGAVAELLPEEIRSEMDTHLAALAGKELIRPGGTSFAGEGALRFAHLLIRDAAYEQMLKETRAELHERFVGWLARRAEARAVEYEEIIGYHLEQAYRYREELGPLGDRDVALARQAAQRLATAGRRALARGDMPAAVNLLERAVSLLPSGDPQHPDLLLKLGIALAESGELGRADALLSERIREARRGLPFLSYRDGAGKQQIFDLDGAVSRVRIGRKPSNDIPLEWDREVSRTHASLVKVDDRWVLLDDERSRNGSFVNGQRVIDRRVLEDGDILRFGDTLILYRSPVASDVLARGRLDPRSTTATATGLPAAVFLSEAQRNVLLALCGLLEEGGAASGAAADEEIAKQLSLDVQAVRENLWALSHVFDTEQTPGAEGVALLIERARQQGVIAGTSPAGHVRGQ